MLTSIIEWNLLKLSMALVYYYDVVCWQGVSRLRAEEVGVVHDLYFCGAHYGHVSALTFINGSDGEIALQCWGVAR